MTTWEVVPGLPRLEVPAPVCGHCGEDVQLDGDAAWCETCRVAWDRICDGDVSHPDLDEEGADAPCRIVPPPVRGVSFTLVNGPCVLPSGHDGEHLCPMRRRER